MSGKQERKVYWDSCLFIAWLKPEIPGLPQCRRTQDEIAGMDEQVRRFENGDLHIVTSVLSITEVLSGDMAEIAMEKFNNLPSMHNFHLVDVTRRTCNTTKEIRDYYRLLGDGYPTLEVPDAIHIASAIENKCSHFYTFDSMNKLETNKRPKRGLIPLGNLIADKYTLIIQRPSSSEPQLPLLYTAEVPKDRSSEIPTSTLHRHSGADQPPIMSDVLHEEPRRLPRRSHTRSGD